MKDAGDVLGQMARQGFKISTSLCNQVMAGWITLGGTIGQKQALQVYALMKQHQIYPNERSVALAMVAALGGKSDPSDLVASLANYQRLDMYRVGKIFVQYAGAEVQELAEKLRALPLKRPRHLLITQQVLSGIEEAHQALLDLQAVRKPAPPADEERELDPIYQEQFNLETRANLDAVSKYRMQLQNVINLGRGANTGPVKDILLLWYEPLVREIAEEQRKIGAKEVGVDRSVYGPRLLTVGAEQLAVITMHETLGCLLVSPAGTTVTNLALAIGAAVQAEAFNCKKRQDKTSLMNYLRNSGSLLTVNTVNKAMRFCAKQGEDEVDVWGPKMQAKVGSALTEMLLRVAKVPENFSYESFTIKRREARGASKISPPSDTTGSQKEQHNQVWVSAFHHEYRYQNGKRVGYVTCLPEILETIEQGHQLRETVHARYLPMLVPPKPWTAPSSGGYLAYSLWVMRFKGSEMQRKVLKEAPLEQVYKALDILGSTPWLINGFVLDVVQEAWDRGGGILDLPSRTDLEIPVPPASFPEDDPQAQRRFKSLQKKVIQQQRDLHSLRCSLRHQLEIAKEFRNREIYFPHNVDFRGRAYPIPPHLNQMGSDLSRGLLVFSEPKPLGPRGIFWLKVHLANLFGNDKITHVERVSFIENSMEDIRLSVRDPLGQGTWWKRADNPWQTLSVAKVLTDALDSPNPEEFLCRVPVHQDGSCNGLQHYAALGGDIMGAEAVNLLPRPAPQDVYGGVAKLVARRVEEDAARGNTLAQELRGKIDRKIVKQTVMTSVYGVTFVGAKRQIQNAMKGRNIVKEDEAYLAATYIAKHLFASLAEMFIGARQIQAWLGTCARLIAKAGRPVTWTTPLGLPVVQSYRRNGRSAVVTLLQTLILEEHHDKLPVNVARQTSAFAPNYVHSLDSTHMMLTAHRMHQEGLTFASVHDSFWTHACDVDKMNAGLRDSFVALHGEPVLEQLLAHFKNSNPDIEFPPLPARGQLDLQEVLRSPYFFH